MKRLPQRPRGRWQQVLVESDSFLIVGSDNDPKGTRATPLAICYSMEGKELARWDPARAANAITTAWHITISPETKDAAGAYGIAINGYDYFGRGQTGDGITTLVVLDEILVPLRQVALCGSDTWHPAFFLQHNYLLMIQQRTSCSGPGRSGNPRILFGNTRAWPKPTRGWVGRFTL